MLNPPCRTTLLPRHARRLLAFFEQHGLINDQDRLRLPPVLNQVGAQIIPDSFVIPPGAPQQMLHAIGNTLAKLRKAEAGLQGMNTAQASDLVANLG